MIELAQKGEKAMMGQKDFEADDTLFSGDGYYDVRYWTPIGIASCFGYLSRERGVYWLDVGTDEFCIHPNSIHIDGRKDFIPLWQVKMPASCRPAHGRRIALTV